MQWKIMIVVLRQKSDRRRPHPLTKNTPHEPTLDPLTKMTPHHPRGRTHTLCKAYHTRHDHCYQILGLSHQHKCAHLLPSPGQCPLLLSQSDCSSLLLLGQLDCSLPLLSQSDCSKIDRFIWCNDLHPIRLDYNRVIRIPKCFLTPSITPHKLRPPHYPTQPRPPCIIPHPLYLDTELLQNINTKKILKLAI